MATLFDGDKPRVKTRMPCPECGYSVGMVSRSGPHIKVSCENCERYLYFAPAEEIERTKVDR